MRFRRFLLGVAMVTATVLLFGATASAAEAPPSPHARLQP
ncbi:unnamed protein product, partial [marine sediment metagenome]